MNYYFNQLLKQYIDTYYIYQIPEYIFSLFICFILFYFFWFRSLEVRKLGESI